MLWMKAWRARPGCCGGGSGTGSNLSGGLLEHAYQTKLATLHYAKREREREGERDREGGAGQI